MHRDKYYVLTIDNQSSIQRKWKKKCKNLKIKNFLASVFSLINCETTNLHQEPLETPIDAQHQRKLTHTYANPKNKKQKLNSHSFFRVQVTIALDILLLSIERRIRFEWRMCELNCRVFRTWQCRARNQFLNPFF